MGKSRLTVASVDVRRFSIHSRHFGAQRWITVLVPESYGRHRRRYPTLYLHDGSHDWFYRGRLLDVLESADIPEILVVLPEPVDRTREYKLSRAHIGFMTEEIVPWADATLRTRVRREARAVHGVSLGGLSAVWLGLRNPELFASAGGQGGAFWYWKGRVVREAEHSAGSMTRFFILCSRQDGNIHDNRALHEAMTRSGIEHAYKEVPGRHSWACWRRTMAAALTYYFGRPPARPRL